MAYTETNKKTKSSSISKLIDFVASDNIAKDLDEQKLAEIGDLVKNEFDIDLMSMEKWLERVQESMKIAMQVCDEKNDPWEGAANVKFPLIANGAITFASREYPQVVRGDKVVEVATYGLDPEGIKARRARRLAKHMSWQLLVESDDWESETDKLLVMDAVIGTTFRKIYYNPITKQIEFELCRPDRIVINNNAKNLEKARRITHIIHMSKNDIIERMRLGLFCEYKHDEISPSYISADKNNTTNALDSDSPHEILEQHRYLDLDEDGYSEPYIVTYHVGMQKVLRIVARYDVTDIKTDSKDKLLNIVPQHYFTDFHFLPSPDGTFFSMGLGTLLYPLNESINTLINQLLDAGTLANLQAGFFGPGIRIKDGQYKFKPGEWKKLEGAPNQRLPDHVMALPTTPPSPVLFQLLGLMIDVGKELSSVTEILQGKQPTQNSPATTVLALIKQGLVQYNAIHKRILRAFKKEFQKLFTLNRKYLDVQKYLNVMDDPDASDQDFNSDDLDVRTVADPNLASDMQRMAKAELVLNVMTPQNPVALQQYLEAADVQNIEELFKGIPQEPAPDDQLTLAKAETEKLKGQTMLLDYAAKSDEQQLSQEELKLKRAELVKKLEEMDATIRNLDAHSINLHAQAAKYRKEAEVMRPDVQSSSK